MVVCWGRGLCIIQIFCNKHAILPISKIYTFLKGKKIKIGAIGWWDRSFEEREIVQTDMRFLEGLSQEENEERKRVWRTLGQAFASHLYNYAY